jgi:REP element-mobilizing transposase RayT
MRSRYKVVESEGIYFLTSTIVHWIPVFTSRDACDIVIDSLAYCRKAKGLRIYAYVIMENHVHLVADAPDLSGVMQSFKRHTARALIADAEVKRKDWLLNQLTYYRQKHKEDSDYQVWQEGVHPQLVLDDAMLWQKVEYVHNNPVRRGYVDAVEHWRYSSARCYVAGEPPVMTVDLLPGR